MAEGPSIAILKERAARFIGREIVRVEGDTPIAKERLLQQRIAGQKQKRKETARWKDQNWILMAVITIILLLIICFVVIRRFKG